MRRFFLAACATALAASAQIPRREKEEKEHKLPDGRSQNEEILKADYKKSLEDAAELFRLAEEVKIELEKNDRHILSMSLVKKTEDIEKVAKRLRGRMKRY